MIRCIDNQCNIIQDLFNCDESLFKNKAESIINNPFGDYIDSSFDNTYINYIICNQEIMKVVIKLIKSSEYISLMNKLIELEKKVQDTKQ